MLPAYAYVTPRLCPSALQQTNHIPEPAAGPLISYVTPLPSLCQTSAIPLQLSLRTSNKQTLHRTLRSHLKTRLSAVNPHVLDPTLHHSTPARTLPQSQEHDESPLLLTTDDAAPQPHTQTTERAQATPPPPTQCLTLRTFTQEPTEHRDRRAEFRWIEGAHLS